MYKLISATPSPYARKVRIQLAEKGIPFELITEVPWNSATQTTRWNPLENLPVLLPPDLDGRLAVKRFEVIADGATGTLLRYLSVRWPDNPWRTQYPQLSAYADRLEELLVNALRMRAWRA